MHTAGARAAATDAGALDLYSFIFMNIYIYMCNKKLSWGRNTGGRTNTSASRYNNI